MPPTIDINFSFTAKVTRRAHDLLERAKRAMEIAIEDSEAAALAYLDQHAPGQ